MGRLIRFIVVVGVLVAGAVWLADHPGAVMIQWLGWRVDTSVPLLLLGLLVAGWAVVVLLRVLARVLGLPSLIGGRLQMRQARKGLAAAAESVAALIAEDGERARKTAKTAARCLEGEVLGLALQARAASLVGDRETLREVAEPLIETSTTVLAGLRLRFEDALQTGQSEEALRFSARAVSLQPKAVWAVKPRLDLLVRRGDWDEALDLIKIGRKSGVFTAAEADRKSAAIYCRRVDDAALTGNPAEAVRWARKAVAADETFVPAALRLVRAFAALEDSRKAVSAVETAWKHIPHRDLADAYMALFAKEDRVKRATRAQHLAALDPLHRESRLLVAREALEAGLWGEARAQLLPLVETANGDAQAAVLMARIAWAEHKDMAEANHWLERAVAAHAAEGWECEACGHRATAWEAFCPECGAFATVVPLR